MTTTTFFWTLQKARSAVPYVRSCLRSVRESALELKAYYHRRDMIRLGWLPWEKPDCKRVEALTADLAGALAELARINVTAFVDGVAMFPWEYKKDMAWLVFELYDERGLTSWRMHCDPISTRRSLKGVK